MAVSGADVAMASADRAHKGLEALTQRLQRLERIIETAELLPMKEFSFTISCIRPKGFRFSMWSWERHGAPTTAAAVNGTVTKDDKVTGTIRAFDEEDARYLLLTALESDFHQPDQVVRIKLASTN